MFGIWPQGMRDLSCSTGDKAKPPALEGEVLNLWTNMEVPFKEKNQETLFQCSKRGSELKKIIIIKKGEEIYHKLQLIPARDMTSSNTLYAVRHSWGLNTWKWQTQPLNFPLQ